MNKGAKKISEEIFGIDSRSLALLRILLSLLIIYDLIVRFFDLEAHYSDLGIFPRYAVPRFCEDYLSLHMISGATEIQAILFFIQLIFAIMLLCGYKTRLATVISWILLISLHERNPMVLSGGDRILRMLLFWGMFLPLKAHFSIDNKLNINNNVVKKSFSVASAGLLLQVLFIYLFAFIFKLKDSNWMDGSAIYYGLRLDHFTRPLGTHLLNYPELLKYLTNIVLWFEGIGCILLFMPFFTAVFRLITIPLFFLLQIGFGISFVLGIFPLASSLGMIPFIPAMFWNIFSKKSKPETIVLKASKLNNLLALFFISYIFCWNYTTVFPNNKFPQSLSWIGRAFALEQSWHMFTPPGGQCFWCVIPGSLNDGTRVDVLTGKNEVRWEKPKVPALIYKNNRWSVFYESVILKYPLYGNLVPYLTKYYCYQWNKTHKDGKKLKELELYAMFEKTPPPGKEQEPPQKVFFWKQYCE